MKIFLGRAGCGIEIGSLRLKPEDWRSGHTKHNVNTLNIGELDTSKQCRWCPFVMYRIRREVRTRGSRTRGVVGFVFILDRVRGDFCEVTEGRRNPI